MPRKTRPKASRNRDAYRQRCAEEALRDLKYRLQEERRRQTEDVVVDGRDHSDSEGQ